MSDRHSLAHGHEGWREQAAEFDQRMAPVGDMPDGLTVNGHLFVHVAACPCPRIQAEVVRLTEQRDDTAVTG